MKNLAILIDSTGDLDTELRKKYSIGYCAMGLTIKEKEITASLDWDQGYDPHALYEVMRSGEKIFTSQVTRQEYETKFGAELEQGNDILYIACSSALSKSVDMARTVASSLKEKYPDRKIAVVDSLISGYAQGDMAIRSRVMSDEGKTLDEIVAWLEANKLKFNQWAAVETLTYLKKAGRVKASAAFFGNLFGVKPVLISDAKGNNFAVKKVKGRKPSLVAIVEDMIASSEDIENQTIYIAHSDDLEGAKFCKEEILKRVKPKAIHIGILGPIIGGSVGPGTIAIYNFGKEVTVVGE